MPVRNRPVIVSGTIKEECIAGSPGTYLVRRLQLLGKLSLADRLQTFIGECPAISPCQEIDPLRIHRDNRDTICSMNYIVDIIIHCIMLLGI